MGFDGFVPYRNSRALCGQLHRIYILFVAPRDKLSSSPFNSRGRLVGDAVGDGAHFAYLICNTARNMLEKVVGKFGEAGSEPIDTPHGQGGNNMTYARVGLVSRRITNEIREVG